ncbi:MAG: phosphoribosyltransferase [Candidatus Peregrinibacteria bacterium Gr01-1014_25]|nr:MAG: phosphoribosyltransferase [Candidatus Peregrinibacteria bacterium Gr01-1014_25]
MPLPFTSRKEAGAALAALLQDYRGKPQTFVVSLVRGGVAIGRALADALNLPLYPYVVRKLGHPGNAEYAMGAIAEGGATHLDDDAMRMTGVTWEDMQPVIEREKIELQRRVDAYLVKARPDLTGATVILNDDGAATGATMLAAIEDVRKRRAARVVVALPVCPPDTAAALRAAADEVHLLATPAHFQAVGQYYVSFPQLEDAEVLALLRRSAVE